jgi:hypothetical protein
LGLGRYRYRSGGDCLEGLVLPLKPPLELGPDNYRVQDRRGRWQMPEDPRVYVWSLLVSAAVLVTVYVRRDEIDSSNVSVMLGLVAMMAFFAGAAVALLWQFIARRRGRE